MRSTGREPICIANALPARTGNPADFAGSPADFTGIDDFASLAGLDGLRFIPVPHPDR